MMNKKKFHHFLHIDNVKVMETNCNKLVFKALLK